MGANPVYVKEVEPKVEELASVLKDVYVEFDFECAVLEIWRSDEEGIWPPTFVLVPARYRGNALVLTDEDKEILDVFVTEIHGWDDVAYCILGDVAREMDISVDDIKKIIVRVYVRAA
jgi:hypothetical protein